MSRITIGRHPTSGKLPRVYFYGKTRGAVADQLAQGLSDMHRGSFVAPHKLPLGEWPDTFDSYATMIRYHLNPALGHIALKDLRPDQVQHFYNDKRDTGLSPRTVRYLHTILRGALKQAVKNQPVDPRNFTRSFERLLKQAGVPRIRFNDGRHTFATLMLELGKAPKTVQTMLGHTKIATMLDIYSHVSLDLEKKAEARLNAAFRG